MSDQSERLLHIFTDSFLPLLRAGIAFTVPLTLISFALGLVLALLTALARLSEFRPLAWIAGFYVWIIRGTPLLLQLFIIFYGLPSLGILIDAFPAAVIGFTLSVGAYGSEIIRAAIVSIPKGSGKRRTPWARRGCRRCAGSSCPRRRASRCRRCPIRSSRW